MFWRLQRFQAEWEWLFRLLNLALVRLESWFEYVILAFQNVLEHDSSDAIQRWVWRWVRLTSGLPGSADHIGFSLAEGGFVVAGTCTTCSQILTVTYLTNCFHFSCYCFFPSTRARDTRKFLTFIGGNTLVKDLDFSCKNNFK